MSLHSRLLIILILIAVLSLACSQSSANPDTNSHKATGNIASSSGQVAANIITAKTPEATPTTTSTSTPVSTPTPALPTPSPTTSPPKPATPTPQPPSTPVDAKEIVRGPIDGNMVAFTFDAGSAAGPAPKILDILKDNNLKVTIFVTGQF